MAGIRYFLTAVLSALYWNDSLSVHSKSRRTFYKRCRLYYSSTTFLCYWHVDAPVHIKRTSKRNLSDYRHRYFHRGKKQTGKRMVKVYYHIESEGEKRLEQLLKDYYQVTKSIEKILHFDFSKLEEVQ